ncbi:unnamed protein product [Miscanthus lutarioriparius]|uniref:Uncharacterized protein n=1 Tax=Miscanthus lutarioriparius TaxID=422564 RepID=A0A811SL96_9POAL|nr:unnamed protein product [Miscanthus lutarioriparius]
MKLVWCPDTASKAYIDGVRAMANDSADGSLELVAAMAGGWNAQLIVDAPYVDADASPSPSSSRCRPPATSLALTAAVRRTGGRYALLDVDIEAESAMARLEGVDLLVLDAAAVLRAARPGPRGMVVVHHGDTSIGGVRRRAAVGDDGGRDQGRARGLPPHRRRRRRGAARRGRQGAQPADDHAAAARPQKEAPRRRPWAVDPPR